MEVSFGHSLAHIHPEQRLMKIITVAPAILSELYIEGAMSHFCPQWPQTEDGLNKFVRAFSWPGGIPSHVNAEYVEPDARS